MKFTLVTCVFCLFTSAAQAEWNVKTLLSHYDTGTSNEKELLSGIISGTENGMGWANTFLETYRKEDALYCVPPHLALNGDQLMDMLRKEVKDHPSEADSSYGLVLMLALRKVFPCQPHSN